MHRSAVEGHRVLIVAPFGRDAESIAGLLAKENYDAHIFRSIGDLIYEIHERAGVVVLTEEALSRDDQALRETLLQQPDWSDLPFIFLAARKSESTRIAESTRVRLLSFANNVIVLERPLSGVSLVSAIAAAMRARQKQFQMRDRLAERDKARQALAESEDRLRLATDAAEIGFWDVDPINKTLFWPPLVKAMFGISPDVLVTMDDFYNGLHPEDAPATVAAYKAAADPQQRALYDVEYRTVGKEDGIIRWVAAKGRGIFADADICTRLIGTAIDITTRKANEQALIDLNMTLEERVKERTKTLLEAEEALRQSQKMEAVGQLTGGIAHDFNNMLTGIIGSLDIMKRRIVAGRLDDLERFMDAAKQSANRAAALTARLLAFSRRQSLDLKPIDPNELLRSLEDLLRRTLRENISLRLMPGTNVGHAQADENQLESAILNLAINARDAMPEGGTLTVETRVSDLDSEYAVSHPGIAPGRYVIISVADTGVGMSRDILDKVVEPFFTTKPIGQGTGLGLSMVYGFAQQVGGQLLIDSTPGAGTTVSIYLRAAEPSNGVLANIGIADVAEGKGQNVLLVEDDPAVRQLIKEVLEELSYASIEAEDADKALQILRSHRTIDLMVSDVGLPGINGRQLADIARTHRPELPILFVTGYAENAAIRADFLGTNMAMIAKPFSLDSLAAKISDMLPQKG